jgi:hypothetical protein
VDEADGEPERVHPASVPDGDPASGAASAPGRPKVGAKRRDTG